MLWTRACFECKDYNNNKSLVQVLLASLIVLEISFYRFIRFVILFFIPCAFRVLMSLIWDFILFYAYQIDWFVFFLKHMSPFCIGSWCSHPRPYISKHFTHGSLLYGNSGGCLLWPPGCYHTSWWYSRGFTQLADHSDRTNHRVGIRWTTAGHSKTTTKKSSLNKRSNKSNTQRDQHQQWPFQASQEKAKEIQIILNRIVNEIIKRTVSLWMQRNRPQSLQLGKCSRTHGRRLPTCPQTIRSTFWRATSSIRSRLRLIHGCRCFNVLVVAISRLAISKAFNWRSTRLSNIINIPKKTTSVIDRWGKSTVSILIIK